MVRFFNGVVGPGGINVGPCVEEGVGGAGVEALELGGEGLGGGAVAASGVGGEEEDFERSIITIVGTTVNVNVVLWLLFFVIFGIGLKYG